MIEVFITNIQDHVHAENIINLLKGSFPELIINFDITGPVSHFPCDHSILRIEGTTIDSENIISKVNQSGFLCDLLKDRICY